MSDLISRQAAIDALVNKGQASTRYKLSESWELNSQEIREALNAVPPAQPERKTGRWEINKHTYAGLNRKNWKCTNCCTGMYDFILTSACKPGWKFCPNCGAKMKGETE